MADLQGGLIGCGFFARNHLHGWREVSGAQIVAVCDIDEESAQEKAAQFGIDRVYADAKTMLASEQLDFVDIVTQPDSHRALVALAAEYKTPVICQKPLASTLEDARTIVDVCRRAGIPLMVHENFRWQVPMQVVKQIIESLGPLFFGRISFRSAFDIYAVQPYLATDERFIIFDLGVHLLDLARFFFGEFTQLYCQSKRVNADISAEDTATIMLQAEDGATCIVDMSYASRLAEEIFPQTLIHLEGPKGAITVGPNYQVTVSLNGQAKHQTIVLPDYDWLEPPNQVVQYSVVPIQQHWVSCLNENRIPETSGEDNLRTLALVFAAYASAEQGRPIQTPYQQILIKNKAVKTDMTTIALVGAAGKMGGRLTERFRESSSYRVLYVESGEAGIKQVRDRGDVETPLEVALQESEVVILAVPDVLVGKVAEDIVPRLNKGAMVMCLDPAAPYAGKLPQRTDITYFATHPCHPPVFKDEDDPEARRDYFGAGKAKQSIVNALIQGPEADYDKGEATARVMWGPILRSHRVTLQQMAYLEPVLSETVAQTCVVIMREALDEAVARGIPEGAARDFVLGHVGIQLAIFFDEIDWEISDGAKKVLKVAKSQLIRDDWKRVFEPHMLKESVGQIVGDIPVE